MDDDSDDGDIGLLAVFPKKRCSDIRGCGDFYIYLKQNPRTFVAATTVLSSLTIILFVGISYSIDFHPNTCYFTSGLVGIVTNAYLFCHFRTLMNLKKEVDVYSVNNKNFAEENGNLKVEVNRFTIAKNGNTCMYISLYTLTCIHMCTHRAKRDTHSHQGCNCTATGEFE